MTDEARFHTSVTERWSFRTCRRRWYLETVERLAPKGQVTWYLIFGDIIHAALDTYYRPSSKSTKPPRKIGPTLKAFKAAWLEKDAWLRERYGAFYKMGIEDEWEMHLRRGEEMLHYYDIYDRAHPFFDSVIDIGVEDRSFQEILDPEWENLPGAPLLSGRVDIVAERSDGIWIIDHKALAGAPSNRALDVDDQLTGYAYLYWRMTGTVAQGELYNVLIKDPPKPPRMLKDGSLSKDKAQRTTWELYHTALLELGLDESGYEDMLTYLADKGWKQFFWREGVNRNYEELESFHDNLYYEYLDMVDALAHPEKRYPNASQYTCPGCPVMAICQAMNEKGDVDFIIANGYEVQEPRVTIPKGV